MTVKTAAEKSFWVPIRKGIAAFVLATSMFVSTPRSAQAVVSGHIEDSEHYDGRVQNYDPDVELPSASNGMTWFLVLLLGVISVSVMFKDAKRSHLD